MSADVDSMRFCEHEKKFKKNFTSKCRAVVLISSRRHNARRAINKYIHTMNPLLTEIHDLFAFQLKQAQRHDLDEIRITVPRAKSFCNAIRIAKHHERVSKESHPARIFHNWATIQMSAK